MPSRTQRCQNAGGRGKEGGGEFRTSIEMGELVLLKGGTKRVCTMYKSKSFHKIGIGHNKE